MADQKNTQTEVVQEIMNGIERLHLIGGLGLVLVGGAILIFALSAIFQTVADAAGTVPRFYDFTLVMAVIGAIVGAGERFLEYRLTERRLQMMASVTEQLVQGAIPKNDKLKIEDVGNLVREVFGATWASNK